MYPLKLSPAFKDYLWGGTRLRDDFGKECSYEKIAEIIKTVVLNKKGNYLIFFPSYEYLHTVLNFFGKLVNEEELNVLIIIYF